MLSSSMAGVSAPIKTLLSHDMIDLVCQLQPDLGEAANLTPTDFRNQVQTGLKMERPRHEDHGDFAVNVSFLAKHTRLAPPVIAAKISDALSRQTGGLPMMATPVAGFVNLTLQGEGLATILERLTHCTELGKNRSLQQERILLEFVSANPTGPLHIGHGRWAAMGDSLRRILEWNGAKVVSEFYINDYGQQMANMANSIWFRCLEQLELGQFPEPEGEEKFPYYPGDYVKIMASDYLKHPDSEARIRQLAQQHGPVRLELDTILELKALACQAMGADQKDLLEKLGVGFDVWTSETTLHETGRVKETLEALKQTPFVYEQEGALWLKSSELGDEKDRVLVKSDGSYTYLTADIAYHHEKFSRCVDNNERFTQCLNIWGADHHGYIPRLKGALQALGENPDRLVIVLGQLVHLVVNGEPMRMGKRSKMMTLADVTETVGVDATRFWLVSRSADTTIEFDVDLAKSYSDENPVYYAQYAHARACSILNNAFTAGVSSVQASAKAPHLSTQEWEHFLKAPSLTKPFTQYLWHEFQDDTKAQRAIRSLILLLDQFELLVQDAGRLHSPYLVARYCLDVAAQFHSFYAVCRVLSETPEKTMARLALVRCVQRTLEQALALLGVSAPKQM
jgi:arginyl-tRNA synthetase